MKREITSIENIKPALSGFNTNKWAFDVETRDKKQKQQTTNWYDLEIFAMTLYDGETSILVNLYNTTHEEKKKLLQALFHEIAPNRAKNTTVIAHNIPFDAKCLLKYDVSLYNGDWFDTLVAHHLLDERKRHGLKTLAESWLGADTLEFDTAYDSEEMCPMFERYCRRDTKWTWELAQEFWPKLKQQGLDTLFKRVEMPFQRCIVEMETNGVKFNKGLAYEYKSKLKDNINNLEIQMCDVLDMEYDTQHTLDEGVIIKPEMNFASHAQVRNLLYEDLELEAKTKTDAGNPSTGMEALQQLKNDHEIIPLLIKHRKANQLLSNFFNVLPELVDGDGRIRTNYLDFGAVTGRLSSREPNLQNLADGEYEGVETRECFEASDGKKMIAIDYSSQELRVAAQVTGDETMKNIVEEGIDPHLLNANTVFDLGIPREKLKESHPEYKDLKNKYKKSGERAKAKIFTYGILYGATKYRISNEFNCSLDQAEKYLEQYFEKYPGVKETMDEIEETIEEQGYVESIYGRRRRFSKKEGDYGEYYPPSVFRQGFNFLVQSPSSDMMRVAMVKLLNYKHNNPEYGVDILMTVHDEVVLECNEEYAETVCEECTELVSEVVGDKFVVDMPADGDIGDTYAEAK